LKRGEGGIVALAGEIEIVLHASAMVAPAAGQHEPSPPPPPLQRIQSMAALGRDVTPKIRTRRRSASGRRRRSGRRPHGLGAGQGDMMLISGRSVASSRGDDILLFDGGRWARGGSRDAAELTYSR